MYVPSKGSANKFFEMRLESIGGLGAHLAGQMLAEAGILGMGLTGAHFSSYGSEKKGSPVKSYVRLGPATTQLRNTSPAREPNLVAIFHEALLADPGVIIGLKPGAVLVVNTVDSPQEIARRLALPGGIRVITVDAIGIAVQENTRVNTAMLGVIVKAAPILTTEAVAKVISATFSKKYPQLVKGNIRTFERGQTEVQEYVTPESASSSAPASAPSAGTTMGWKTQPIGGLVLGPGSTIHKNLSPSRQGFLPVLNQAECVNCSICDLVCPDYCFVWEPTGKLVNGVPSLTLKGIDYQYCKGCMHCVTECPTGALSKEREVDGITDRLRVPLPIKAQVGVPAGADYLAQRKWGAWGGSEQEGAK